MSWNEPTFERPKGVRIVDMCIYVDENFPRYVKNPNQSMEDKLTKYIYWIIDSLAKKHALFGKNYQYYDEFALFATSEIFCIIRKKLEHQGEIIRGKEVKPIKSVLNFVKAILYPYKVQFEQQSYLGIAGSKVISDTDTLAENMREEVRQQYLKDLQEQLTEITEELPKDIIKEFMYICPYRRDPAMMKKIYISVVLTLIENISLRVKVEDKIGSKQYKKDVKKLMFLYANNTTKVILWHLPEDMEDYIRFLTMKVKRIVSNKIAARRNSYDLADDVINDIIKTGFTTYDQDQENV